MTELLCPNCRQPLDLGQAQSFDFLFMGRVECQECGVSVMIEDNVPRLPRDGEPDSPVNRPEDAMIGVMYRSLFDQKEDIVIEDASSWVFENTGLSNGDHLPGLLGQEVDQMFAHAPPGTKRIAHSPYQDVFGRNLNSDMVVYASTSNTQR